MGQADPCVGGMGLGNVLLPPAIKHYFPQRIGALTGLYLVLTTVSASLPSLVAVPMTDALGWRFSVGIWGVLGFAAARSEIKSAEGGERVVVLSV